ncbi:MAG: hypothetical protein WA459_04110, partial [Stellaceae bacterium]
VPLDPGLYAFSLAAQPLQREPEAGLVLPVVQVCAAPRQDGALEITDSFGRPGSWLGGRGKVLFVKSPAGGSAALVTGYLAREPDSTALELNIRRVAAPGPMTPATAEIEREPSAGVTALAEVMTLRLGNFVAEEEPQSLGLDIVAHIRDRGDVRFLDTPWVGRLGPGLWIEGFTIVPDGRLAPAVIEYKGLSAVGTETPWLDSGALCGTRGMGIPLIGFAVRQKAVPGDAPFDCEYTGYFQSGATAGPTRNGAPCRSTIDNDALEGMELRITPRPTRRAGSKRA